MGAGRCYFVWLVSLFTATGAFYPIFARGIMTSQHAWKYGLALEFRKPCFQTFLAFFGSAILFLVYLVLKKCGKVRVSLQTDAEVYRLCGVASLFSVLATAIDFFTLFYIPTTVWQAFHSWQVMFSSIFAMTLNRQRLRFTEWIGLFLLVAGISICGVSSLLRSIKNNSDQTSAMFFSFVLVIFGSGIKAFATGIEEYLMNQDDYLVTPLQLTVFEGIWGIYISGLMALPVVNILHTDNPMYESTLDIHEYFKRSYVLVFAELGFLLLITMYAYLALVVVSKKSAVDRFVYESLRPLAILVLSGVYYFISGRATSDSIDAYVFGEISGVVVLFLGTLVCMNVIKCPCFSYNAQTDTDAFLEALPDRYLRG